MAKPTGPNKENLEKTRAQLLSVARHCFAEYGFHKTSTTMIIDMARSSRGSLYHHFQDKTALFKAVYDALCLEMAHIIHVYPYKNIDPVEDLMDGCIVYLNIFTDKAFAQIMLVDGPNVLGMDYCRSQDYETAYKALKDGVREIIQDISKTTILADFLSGALDTYALRIGTAEERLQMFKNYSGAFRQFAGLLFSNFLEESLLPNGLRR